MDWSPNLDHTVMFLMSGVLAAGFACQWLAWRVKIPAILPLIGAGLIAGPLGLALLHPQEQLGELYFPIVSLSVAVILFEGSLTLNFREVRKVAAVVRNLLVVGAAVSWFGGAAAAHYFMGLPWSLSFLFGALIVVTGPTVIAPLVRNVRPTAGITSVLKWEGILIDPLGALLAVLVFDFIVIDAAGVEHTIFAFFRIIVVGAAFGISSGYVIYALLDRYLIPDYLRDFAILATVTGIFTLSNSFATESGLLAVTVMGIFLANTDLKAVARDLVLQRTAHGPVDIDALYYFGGQYHA
jgi:NhaP-type Na+/H+ or K+/H+ antiporter